MARGCAKKVGEDAVMAVCWRHDVQVLQALTGLRIDKDHTCY